MVIHKKKHSIFAIQQFRNHDVIIPVKAPLHSYMQRPNLILLSNYKDFFPWHWVILQHKERFAWQLID